MRTGLALLRPSDIEPSKTHIYICIYIYTVYLLFPGTPRASSCHQKVRKLNWENWIFRSVARNQMIPPVFPALLELRCPLHAGFATESVGRPQTTNANDIAAPEKRDSACLPSALCLSSSTTRLFTISSLKKKKKKIIFTSSLRAEPQWRYTLYLSLSIALRGSKPALSFQPRTGWDVTRSRCNSTRGSPQPQQERTTL